MTQNSSPAWGTTTFVTGAHVGLVARYTIGLLEGALPEARGRFWSMVSTDTPLDDILEALSSTGIKSLPDFVLAQVEGDNIRIVARGATKAVVTTDGGEREEIDASGVRTWTEDVVADVASITMEIGDSSAAVPDRGEFAVLAGAVPAVSLTRRFDEADELADAGSDWSGRTPAVAAAAPLADAAGDTSDSPAAEPVAMPADLNDEAPSDDAVSDEPLGDDVAITPTDDAAADAEQPDVAAADAEEPPAEEPPAEEIVVGSFVDPVDDTDQAEPALAEAPEVELEPVDDSSAEGEMRDVAVPDDAAADSVIDGTGGVVVEIATDDIDPSVPDLEQADDDGLTEIPPSTQALWGGEPDIAAPPESSVPSLDDAPPPAAPAPGVVPSAAPFDAEADLESSLAADEQMEAAAPGPIPGPRREPRMSDSEADVAAVLAFSNGERIIVDRPVLVGRNPKVTGDADDPLPILMKYEGPSQGLSRTHAEIRVDAGQLVIEDLRSTNGTDVQPPNGPRQRVEPGSPYPLVPGTLIDFGDELRCMVESPV